MQILSLAARPAWIEKVPPEIEKVVAPLSPHLHVLKAAANDKFSEHIRGKKKTRLFRAQMFFLCRNVK